MHPAFSVIFFTTSSGAGYGLLALLGILAAAGLLPTDPLLGFVAMAVALGLITAGLLSSAGHLGRPERAWRAFSQWRSSWLSREGVMSVATYVPAAAFGIGWVFFSRTGGWVAFAAVLAAIGAALTLISTAMIYVSLKPIPQWSSPYTLPGYLLYAAMTGSVLLNALLWLFAMPITGVGIAALVLIAAAWAWKTATWRDHARLALPATVNSATGLAGGTVRSVEWPNTQESYLMKEMGFRIARKHAARLKLIVHLLAFAVPLVLTALALALSGWVAAIAAVLAVVSQAPGMLTERWLFFAEAKHTVTLYYGR